ncbi:MAG TPA: hypothetical protein VMN60_13700 [Longimicrobiales bacterium]|nr:hypothetical protein [Longimicrobiales bacterium]
MLNILALLAGILTAALGTPANGGGTTTTAASGGSGGEIGDPCDPETYDGPYRCVEDPDSDSGYAIAN